MKILVIGNGFDIAHGLRTYYSDFLLFIRAYKKTGGVNKELTKIISNNVWIEYFDSIFEENNRLGRTGWIDFESEICTVIEALDCALLSYYKYKNDDSTNKTRITMDKNAYEILRAVLKFDYGKSFSCEKKQYIKMINDWKKKLLDDLDGLIRSLEIYLSSFLGSCSSDRLAIIESIKPDYVLSFNYTNTYEKQYSRPLEIDYIHGAIREDTNTDNNMVLGIGEFLNDKRKDNDNVFIEFKKFYQRIYKNTGSKYKSWLNDFVDHNKLTAFDSATEMYKDLNIYFYGHSLDPTDGDILSDLIECEYAKVTIYYHNKEALSKLISNLVKVIGEENTISLTNNSNGRIKFVPVRA